MTDKQYTEDELYVAYTIGRDQQRRHIEPMHPIMLGDYVREWIENSKAN